MTKHICKNLSIKVIVVLCCFSFPSSAQKKLVENDTYKHWSRLEDYNISNNGEHLWYRTYCLDDLYKHGSAVTLYIKSLNSTYCESFRGVNSKPLISSDNKKIFFNVADSLVILDLHVMKKIFVPGVKRFMVPKDGDGRWLSYQQEKGVVLKNLLTGKEKLYNGATASYFNNQGTRFVVQDSSGLFWIKLSDLSETRIFDKNGVENICFDTAGMHLAFFCKTQTGIELHSYTNGMTEARIVVSNTSKDIPHNREISNSSLQFSKDGKNLFFKLRLRSDMEVLERDAHFITDKVDIWHYKDKYLQSQQLEELPRSQDSSFWAFSLLGKNKVHQIETSEEVLQGAIGNNFVLIRNRVPESESFWNKEYIYEYYLLSVENNKRKLLLRQENDVLLMSMSPNERFILWYDVKRKQYFTYEIATESIRNITKSINVPLNRDDVDREETSLSGVAGWFDNDNSLLIYDQYDVWRVDPTSKRKCLNLTNGYGRRRHISFRILERELKPSYLDSDTITLTALDMENKNNGFWVTTLNSTSDPVMYNMDNCIYYFPYIFVGTPPPPLKAQNADVYLIQKMTALESPNLYITKNFKQFRKISDIHPEKDFNWLTTELIHWKISEGNIGSGILYKPENFDNTKKYPIIFHYYEKRSNELNKFWSPEMSAGGLNIPWYVSHGYLVFVPDIRHPLGVTGQSASNAVISAANHLIQFSWIDRMRMGLQGHSHGGYETNYIVTQTGMFVAAISSAGLSDLVSEHGGLGFGGKSLAYLTEMGQLRLGTPPWETPSVYISNSPIFHVNKITTPLLLIHNKNDGAVSFSQSVELFTELRRLKKQSWLLQYDGEGHTFHGDQACTLDFNIRQQQFFEHYLKGQPAPVWLTIGRPAAKKNIESGLGLDLIGKCSKTCPVCNSSLKRIRQDK